MKNSHPTAFRLRAIAFFALIAIVLSPTSAFAQDAVKVWSKVATGGTVDESDVSKVVFKGTDVSLAGIQPTSAVIRYNVVAVDGLFADLTPTSWPEIFLRYRDAGDRERVRARLIEVDLGTGSSRTAANFDSDLFPQSPSLQTQGIGDCGAFAEFDFASGKAYYIEVEIIRNVLGGAPRVALVGASRYGVCDAELPLP